MHVRDLTPQDEPTWLSLWREYCSHFAEGDLGSPVSPFAVVTDVVWQRLSDPNGPICGLVAEVDGQIVGFCHYVLHVHSWGVGLMCHCEDLFVTASSRNSRAGTALLDALLARGREQGWDRIYGSTDTDNTGARRLYGRFVQEEDRRIFQVVLRDYGWH